MQRRKVYVIGLLAMLLSLSLGCAFGSGTAGGLKTDRAVKTSKSSVNTNAVTMTVGDTVIEAELDDSETSREFMALLPRNFKMQRYNDREYYARLPKLSEQGNAIADFANGDVTYYKNGPSLAIFFAKEETESLGNLIRMGRITSDLKLLQEMDNVAEMTIVKRQADEVSKAVQDRILLSGLYHDMYEYQINKDVDKLGTLMTDDFVLVHMTGLRQPKEEYLRCIQVGQLNYYSEQTDELDIEIDGDTAVMTGRSRVSADVFGGARNVWRLQIVFNLQKINGKWLQTGAVASTY